MAGSGGLTQKYLVVDCEFNQIHYPSMIGKTYNNPPAYARVKLVWVDPMEWPEIN